MSNKTTNVVNPSINTLEAEGMALAQMWTSICKADKKRFTASTKADGFDTRLGKLMLALKNEGSERISSQRLKDCGIHNIDKRRRSEALWFVENEDTCRDFVKKSKKGFTSLTALQAAMRKDAKASDADKQPKADAKSKVGPKQSKTGLEDVPADMTAADVAVSVLDILDAHNISLADFEKEFKAIASILKDENTKKKAA